MVTIVDIARLAGVSHKTVARVINNEPGVSEVTRQRIQTIMQQSGYIYNNAARMLRGGRTRSVGMVIFDMNNAAIMQTVPAMEEVVRAHDYTILLCDSQRNVDTEAANIRRLHERRVDGLIVFGVGVVCPELTAYAESGLPTVLVSTNASIATAVLPYVQVRNDGALAEAMRYLADLGHRRVALVRALVPLPARPQLAELVRATGLPFDRDPELDVVCNGGTGCIESIARLLSRADRPTAMLSHEETFVPYLLQAIRAAGLEIPCDLSLIALGDSPWCLGHTPSITTIRHNVSTAGRLLVEYIFARLDGLPGDVALSGARRALTAELLKRDSCAPPPGR